MCVAGYSCTGLCRGGGFSAGDGRTHARTSLTAGLFSRAAGSEWAASAVFPSSRGRPEGRGGRPSACGRGR